MFPDRIAAVKGSASLLTTRATTTIHIGAGVFSQKGLRGAVMNEQQTKQAEILALNLIVMHLEVAPFTGRLIPCNLNRCEH